MKTIWGLLVWYCGAHGHKMIPTTSAGRSTLGRQLVKMTLLPVKASGIAENALDSVNGYQHRFRLAPINKRFRFNIPFWKPVLRVAKWSIVVRFRSFTG